MPVAVIRAKGTPFRELGSRWALPLLSLEGSGWEWEDTELGDKIILHSYLYSLGKTRDRIKTFNPRTSLDH